MTNLIELSNAVVTSAEAFGIDSNLIAWGFGILGTLFGVYTAIKDKLKK